MVSYRARGRSARSRQSGAWSHQSSARQTVATQSISRLNGPGQAATHSKMRAGGCDRKIPVVNPVDRLGMRHVIDVNVALRDFAQRRTGGLQAGLHMVEHDSVCRSILAGSTSPFSLNGGNPETKIRSPTRTAGAALMPRARA